VSEDTSPGGVSHWCVADLHSISDKEKEIDFSDLPLNVREHVVERIDGLISINDMAKKRKEHDQETMENSDFKFKNGD